MHLAQHGSALLNGSDVSCSSAFHHKGRGATGKEEWNAVHVLGGRCGTSFHGSCVLGVSDVFLVNGGKIRHVKGTCGLQHFCSSILGTHVLGDWGIHDRRFRFFRFLR